MSHTPPTPSFASGKQCVLCGKVLQRPLVYPGQPRAEWVVLSVIPYVGIVHSRCRDLAKGAGLMFVGIALDEESAA